MPLMFISRTGVVNDFVAVVAVLDPLLADVFGVGISGLIYFEAMINSPLSYVQHSRNIPALLQRFALRLRSALLLSSLKEQANL